MERLQFSRTGGKKYSRPGKGAAVTQYRSRSLCQPHHWRRGNWFPRRHTIEFQIGGGFNCEDRSAVCIQLYMMQFQRVGVPCNKPHLAGTDNIRQAECKNGHLRQSIYSDQLLSTVYSYITDSDIPKDRRSLGDGLLFGAGFAAHDVIAGDHNTRTDIFHGPIVKADVLDHASAPAAALDSDTYLRVERSDVAGHNITDAARRFTADHNRAMGVMHSAVGDSYIFGWPIHTPSVGIFSGFEDNAVVASIDIVVTNADIAAGIRHDAVGMWARISLNDDVADGRVLRIEQVHYKHRRADEMHAFHEHILRIHEADKRGA